MSRLESQNDELRIALQRRADEEARRCEAELAATRDGLARAKADLARAVRIWPLRGGRGRGGRKKEDEQKREWLERRTRGEDEKRVELDEYVSMRLGARWPRHAIPRSALTIFLCIHLRIPPPPPSSPIALPLTPRPSTAPLLSRSFSLDQEARAAHFEEALRTQTSSLVERCAAVERREAEAAARDAHLRHFELRLMHKLDLEWYAPHHTPLSFPLSLFAVTTYALG